MSDPSDGTRQPQDAAPVPGELFVLSAPSGTGKSTLIRAMLAGPLKEFGRVRFSISHTTRPQRRGEVDGGDYHFVSRESFDAMIAADEFLEWEEVYEGRLYGTSRQEVFPYLAQGVDVILEIDVRGAERVLSRHPEVHSVFVLPPGFDALRRRLVERDLDSAEDIRGRLALSVWEVQRYPMYEYVIVNDELDRAAEVLAAIILEKRHRLSRMGERTAAVLRDFEAAVAAETSE